MILNSYKKALICMGIAFLITISWLAGSVLYAAFNMANIGKMFWLNLVLNFLLQSLPPTLYIVLIIKFSLRYRAAAAKGLMLCSRCEYPLASAIEVQRCPECGCARTIKAHKEAWEGWRAWLA